MPARREILVIGDALVDVMVQPAAPIRTGADVPAEVRIGFGGQGANLAVRLARQGIGVELVCGLGDDQAGALVTDALRAEGVRLNPVRVAATGAVVILLDEVGERTMLSRRAPFVANVEIPLADWMLLSGYLFLEADVASFARTVGAVTTRRVVVGCAVPEPALTSWRAAVAAVRPDLLILNSEEARALAPTGDLSAGTVVTAPDVAVASVGEVAVTVRMPAAPRAIDTTGAGDAFAAGLLAELLRAGWPPPQVALERAMTSAAVLASQVARAPGAQARVAAEAPA